MKINGIHHYEKLNDKVEIILDVDFENISIKHDAVFIELWDDNSYSMLIMDEGFPSDEYELTQDEKEQILKYIQENQL